MRLFIPVMLVLAMLVGVPLAMDQWQPHMGLWGQPATAEASLNDTMWQPYLRAPGAPAHMIVPNGFWLHPQHSGYRDESRDASLLIFELESPFDQARQRLEPGALAQRNLSYVDEKPVRIDEVPGVLVHATQISEDGSRYAKLMALVGDDRRSIMLVATYPQASADHFALAMEESLLSAQFEPDSRPDVMGGLPMRIDPTRSFTFHQRTDTTITFVLKDGSGDSSRPRAKFVAGFEPLQTDMTDRRLIAEDRLAHMLGVRDVLIHESHYANVAGMPAYEIVATAILNDRDVPCIIHQTLAFDEETVYVLQGAGLYEEGKDILHTFRNMTGSLRIVDSIDLQ